MRKVLISIIVVLLIILLMVTCDNKNLRSKQRTHSNLYEVLDDSLKLQRNKNNQQIAQIRVLESDTKEMLLEVKTKDSIILWLQDVVKKNKGNTVIVTETKTIYEKVYLTDTLIFVDSLMIDSIVYMFPQYETSWDDKWSKGSIKANKDSIYKDITFINEYEIWQDDEKSGIWPYRKSTPVIYWKNNNPNTETTGMRSWRAKTKQNKPFVVMIGGGAGYDPFQNRFGIYFGINVGYKIIQF